MSYFNCFISHEDLVDLCNILIISSGLGVGNLKANSERKIKFCHVKISLYFCRQKGLKKGKNMPKLRRPSVALVCEKTAVKKKTGLAPVQILVTWHGRARKNTGVECDPSKFNPRAYARDVDIRPLVEEIEQRIDVLIKKGEPFTAKDCMSGPKKQTDKLTFSKLVLEMSMKRGLKETTLTKYVVTDAVMKREYGENWDIFSLSVNELMRLSAKWQETANNTTIWCRLSCLRAVLNYAIEEGYTDSNPFYKWKFTKKFRPIQNPRALTESQVEKLWKYWREHQEDWAVGMFLGSITFNGLAFIDMYNYDWSTIQEMDGYYTGITFRSKTNKKVRIVAVKDDDSELVLKFLQGYDWKRASPKNLLCYCNRKLKKNPIIPDLTFYTARHTYATQLMNHNVPIGDIATLLGRSVENISVYLKQLDSFDHLAKIVRRIKPIEII